MRLTFLSFIPLLFFISACTTSFNIAPSSDKSTQKKIQNNKNEASDAQKEYEKLQAQREKEQ
jgi:uncharacterized BrkB/YihY/UPF0761 family membrane protein